MDAGLIQLIKKYLYISIYAIGIINHVIDNGSHALFQYTLFIDSNTHIKDYS